jgi:hypothetical protein
MSFLNPGGLWLLLGIPLLIFLYIIKQKYTERILASSFIWRKSEPLIRRNVKLRKLLRYLLVALQISAIIFSALVLARPVSTEQAMAAKYIVIIDSSGSMQAEQDGESRFARALDQTAGLASDMADGSAMSIIRTGGAASFAVKDTESESVVRRALDTLSCGWAESDISGAVAMAMKEKTDAIHTNIILYTDTDYTETGDVQVVNLANEETNAAALSLTADKTEDGNYTFSGSVASFGKSDTLTVGLYLDGVLKDAKMADCDDGIPTEVIFDQSGVETYAQATIEIEIEDSVQSDNRYVLVNDSSAEKNITPQVGQISAVLSGVSDVPELGGYITTTIKGGAANVLYTEENRPVYAEWEYGLGRVASFTSDLSGYWSGTFLDDLQGVRFVQNIISGMIPGENTTTGLTVDITKNGARASVQAKTLDDSGNAIVEAAIVSPNGDSYTIPFSAVSPGVYEAAMETADEGVYTMFVQQTDAEGQLVAYREAAVAASYSAEYDAFLDGGDVLLASVSNLTGGQVMESGADLFGVEMPPNETEKNPYIPLGLLVALSLLADLAMRNAKWKDIRIFFRSSRKRKPQSEEFP